ncbi:MAG: hypothetical protein IPG96_18605 [Proteobacteria bacterium]|nr:hypothetical protein [Pseudomonadota bacterium]
MKYIVRDIAPIRIDENNRSAACGARHVQRVVHDSIVRLTTLDPEAFRVGAQTALDIVNPIVLVDTIAARYDSGNVMHVATAH